MICQGAVGIGGGAAAAQAMCAGPLLCRATVSGQCCPVRFNANRVLCPNFLYKIFVF